jgi:hypothetical protein
MTGKNMSSPFLTVDEAADFLRASPSSVKAWIGNRQLTPDARAGRKGKWLFLEKTLIAFARQCAGNRIEEGRTEQVAGWQSEENEISEPSGRTPDETDDSPYLSAVRAWMAERTSATSTSRRAARR